MTSEVNGPGKRFTLWLQGCPFKCKGCFNPKLQTKKGGNKISVNEIFKIIVNTKDIEGVSFTGGEPFIQAKSLYFLSKKLKKHSLSILSYTGYTKEEILNSKKKYKILLLKSLDILIDGQYNKNIKSNNSFIGSGNQKIHIFNPCFNKLINKTNFNNNKNIELVINKNGDFLLTGFPDDNILNTLKQINKQ